MRVSTTPDAASRRHVGTGSTWVDASGRTGLSEPGARRLGRMSLHTARLVVFVGALIVLPWGPASFRPASGLYLSWPAPAAMLGVLSLVWPDGRPDLATLRSRSVWGVAGGCAVLLTLACVIGGFPWDQAILLGLVPAPVAVATLWVYRRWSGQDAWYPLHARALGLWAGLSLLAALLLGLLGGLPRGPWRALQAPTDLWNTAQASLDFLVVGLLVFGIFHPLAATLVPRGGRYIPAVVASSVACVALPIRFLDYPLTWLLFIPPLLLGLLGTVRSVAILVTFAPLAMNLLVLARVAHPMPDPLMPLMLDGIVLFAAALVTFRERQARLVSSVMTAIEQEHEVAALLDEVFAAISDGVVLTNQDGTVVLSNPAARAVVGSRARVGAQMIASLYEGELRHVDGRELTSGELRQLEAPAVGESATLRVSEAEGGGAEAFYQVHTRRLGLGPDGDLLILVTDTTAEDLRERELEAFAGHIAHDLKGPLTSVALWVDEAEIEAGDDREAGRRALDRARQAGHRMGEIIDDCLAHSIAREGFVRFVDLDLGPLVREAAASYPATELRMEVVTSLKVHADRTLMRRVLANLIGNAVKYSKPGEGAWVRVVTRADDRPGWVRILVEDKGIGIDEGDEDRIFARFARTAKGSARKEGTGLGLALVRSIIEQHHGTIAAHRNAYGGATFEFTLPQARGKR